MATKANINISNMAPLGEQTTGYQENAIGPQYRIHQTNALKRAECASGGNNRVSRITGLTAGSSADQEHCRRRRVYKKALRSRIAISTHLADLITALESRIVALEAQN